MGVLSLADAGFALQPFTKSREQLVSSIVQLENSFHFRCSLQERRRPESISNSVDFLFHRMWNETVLIHLTDGPCLIVIPSSIQVSWILLSTSACLPKKKKSSFKQETNVRICYVFTTMRRTVKVCQYTFLLLSTARTLLSVQNVIFYYKKLAHNFPILLPA